MATAISDRRWSFETRSSQSSAVAPVVFTLADGASTSFSVGVLELRYRAAQPLTNVVIAPKGAEPLPRGMIPNEILTNLRTTGDGELRLRIPLPTPGLEGIVRVELNFQGSGKTDADTFTLYQFSFTPMEASFETSSDTKSSP